MGRVTHLMDSDDRALLAAARASGYQRRSPEALRASLCNGDVLCRALEHFGHCLWQGKKQETP